MKRREFLLSAGGAATTTAALLAKGPITRAGQEALPASHACGGARAFNGAYEGDYLEHIAFPLGGIGAGMICMEGAGALSHVSLWHHPEMCHEPDIYAALSVKAPTPIARVLEGPVPRRKRNSKFSIRSFHEINARWGLPRFEKASFTARFPFAEIVLSDAAVPLTVKLTGWSPFEPGDADNASLPVAGLEYTFTNAGHTTVEAVFSFNAANFMVEANLTGEAQDKAGSVKAMPGGFQLHGTGAPDHPWNAGAFAVWVADPDAKVNAAWARGPSLDAAALVWRDVESGACYERAPPREGAPAPGASLFVPFKLLPGESKSIALRLAWFVPRSNLSRPGGQIYWKPNDTTVHAASDAYKAWYAQRFADIDAVADYWGKNYDTLRRNTARFTHTFYSSTLAPEILEAVAANLTILKSTTVLRQADGRFWGWEGSWDEVGSCEGSCTHVWNYAQALAHLFPALERTLRETEFGVNQRDDGHQDYRSAMPIRPTPHDFLAAADGQLGGMMKIYRDWRIGGDTSWLRGLWPKVRASLDYCIRTWDPRHKGWLEEPHHNTYDIEFWGPDGMCTSLYLGALQAAVLIGKALGEDTTRYADLLVKGTRRMETELFNGEYFVQHVRWKGLNARFPEDADGYFQSFSPEVLALAEKEGPPYQYGDGCLSDGVLGAWLAQVCGVGQVLDASKVRSHLQAVSRHNFKENLAREPNVQRAVFALGNEGGLLLCTWPRGGKLSLPFGYASEVWTGIEYQVASHLMMMGMLEEGLKIMRACRGRYDGRSRNPFDEIEAGHWYARAMSSYALLQGASGARYDAVDKMLYLKPAIKGDFRCFISTATGYGAVGVKNGKPFLDVVCGEIPYKEIRYTSVES